MASIQDYIPDTFKDDVYVYRPVEGDLQIGGTDAYWLHRWLLRGLSARQKPERQGAEVVAPRSQLNVVVAILAKRYARVHIFMAFSGDVRCTISCQQAKREECVCSCLGLGHKGGDAEFTKWSEEGAVIVQGELNVVHRVVGGPIPGWIRGRIKRPH